MWYGVVRSRCHGRRTAKHILESGCAWTICGANRGGKVQALERIVRLCSYWNGFTNKSPAVSPVVWKTGH